MGNADGVEKVRCAIVLGVGLSFTIVHFVDLAFPTVVHGFAMLVVLRAFAWTLILVEVVVGGDIRGTVPEVLDELFFAKLVLVAATSNPLGTEVATFVTVFPHEAFPFGC